jgi:hypothetical protein
MKFQGRSAKCQGGREFRLADGGDWRFLRGVRGFLMWLMVLGVFAGLSVRVVEFSHSHEHDHHHASEHGTPCDGHGHDHELPDSDEPSNDCPLGEHRHHACCIPLQLAVDTVAGCRLPVPDSFLVGLQSLNLVPPEGPSFDLDKPPLI